MSSKIADRTCNYEVIANNKGWRVIRTSCGCLSDDHILNIEVDKEEDLGVTLIFNYELPAKDFIDLNNASLYCSNNILKEFILRSWEKIKLICKIIFNQHISFEEAFIFRGREHADDVCDYIKKVAKEVEEE